MATQKGKKPLHRKPGDWKTIAAGRRNKPVELVNGRGASGFVTVGEVGSAAYRRMKAKHG